MTAGIEKYLTYLKAKDYSPGTLAWQRSHLERFSSYVAKKNLGIEKVTEDQIRSYLADLKRSGLATRTRQAHLSALKGLFSYLVKEGIITKNPAARVKPPQGTSSLPAVLTVEEMMRLITTPDLSTPVGVRDRAILELLYSSGLRRRELVNLNLSDLDLISGSVCVNQGKGRKDRVVPVGKTACQVMALYLKHVRHWFLRDPREEALFIDSIKGRRMAVGTINYLVKKALKKSGLTKKVSPHTLRHSMATHLLQNQADIRYIQAMLGHASINSTQVYTRLDLHDLKAVHRRAHPHGKR